MKQSEVSPRTTGRKVWFVTGAGRGMGVDISKAALAAGHAVVATGRDTKAVEKAVGKSDGRLVVKLDITRLPDVNVFLEEFWDRIQREDGWKAPPSRPVSRDRNAYLSKSPIVVRRTVSQENLAHQASFEEPPPGSKGTELRIMSSSSELKPSHTSRAEDSCGEGETRNLDQCLLGTRALLVR